MEIPSYEETICIYCKNYSTCNRKEYIERNRRDGVKYSFCEKYNFINSTEIK